MKEEILIFKKRAEAFEEEAKEDFKKGKFDLAAFHIEQSFQLYLKYILAKEIGYFPKTHSLEKLFSELSKINEKFWKFYKENEIILKDIEDAYILARYFPRKYSKEEVEEMVKVLEKFKEEFKEWLT